jgi:hypothetical protein
MVVVGRERRRPSARTVAVWEGELADDVGDASSHQRLVPARRACQQPEAPETAAPELPASNRGSLPVCPLIDAS